MRNPSLPGFPDVAIWVVLTLVIIGLMLVYFGANSRGRNRVIAVLIGLGLLGYVAWIPAQRYLHDHPDVASCLSQMWTEKSLSCSASR